MVAGSKNWGAIAISSFTRLLSLKRNSVCSRLLRVSSVRILEECPRFGAHYPINPTTLLQGVRAEISTKTSVASSPPLLRPRLVTFRARTAWPIPTRFSESSLTWRCSLVTKRPSLQKCRYSTSRTCGDPFALSMSRANPGVQPAGDGNMIARG